jgi:hypothetical protein
MRAGTINARPGPLRAILLALSLALVASLAIGCSGTETTPPAPEPSPTSTPDPEPPAAEPLDVTIYYVRGEHLGVAVHRIQGTKAVAAAALDELLAGPTEEEREAGLASEIPEGTRVLGIDVVNGTATVDLSKEFESGGGSLSMQLRVAQVVYTLTAFPTIDRVAFMIVGVAVQAIGGEGILVDPPVGRLDFADNTAPAILLESPAPWQRVASPVRLTGMANTFEATLLYNVVDPSGRIVAEGFTTATAGSGTWGTFDVQVDFTPEREGIGAIIVWEESAADGSQINLVEIPVRMMP